MHGPWEVKVSIDLKTLEKAECMKEMLEFFPHV